MIGAAGAAAVAVATPVLAQSAGPTDSQPAEPGQRISEASLSGSTAALAGSCKPHEPSARPWRNQLQGVGPLFGRKALITGGDSGMGRAAAIAFAREGADVAINYLPPEQSDADDSAQLIRAAGRKSVLIAGDLKEEAFCERLVADAEHELGGLDILVNCAARQISRDSVLDISTADFDETFKTNVYAMFWVTKAAIPRMHPGSAIINAYDPGENIIDHAATKGAIMIWRNSWRPRASASTPSRQVDAASGHRRPAGKQAS